MDEIIERLYRVIKDAGRVPDYHYAQLRRLQKEWPMLYALLVDFVKEYEEENA